MEELSELLQAQKIAFHNHAPLNKINAINRKIYAIREQQKEQQRKEREQQRITQQQQKAEQYTREKLEH